MAVPTTSLDSRFSEPATEPTSWDDTLRVIETAELFWITTVRADGRPHVTPLPAVWLDDALHFCTGAAEQKAVNLRGNPHVAEGDAVQVTDEPTLHRLAAAWRTKWDGQWQYEVRDGAFHHEVGTAQVYAVAPTKVLAFGKGRFTHTRHRF
jgi:hypothetical protein